MDMSGSARHHVASGQATVDVLERKFERLLDMTMEERAVLRDLHRSSKTIEVRQSFVRAGQKIDQTILVLDGWVARYKSLQDGRRQIISYILPGDFINLYAALFETSEESFRSLSPVTYASIEPHRLLDIFKEHPRLAAMLCWSAGESDAILAEHIVRIGRRSAYERVGHLLLEILIRLEHVGLADFNSYAFPLTQEAIADTLGLSLVHVNRTLKRLRQDNLIEIADDHLTVLDLGALARASKFDRGYLENRGLPDTLLQKLFG